MRVRSTEDSSILCCLYFSYFSSTLTFSSCLTTDSLQARPGTCCSSYNLVKRKEEKERKEKKKQAGGSRGGSPVSRTWRGQSRGHLQSIRPVQQRRSHGPEHTDHLLSQAIGQGSATPLGRVPKTSTCKMLVSGADGGKAARGLPHRPPRGGSAKQNACLSLRQPGWGLPTPAVGPSCLARCV